MTKPSKNLEASGTDLREIRTDASLLDGDAMRALFSDSDNEPLSLAKANWIFGDWHALASIELSASEERDDLAPLAALKAIGFQQLNDASSCKKYLQIARVSGCTDETLNKLLLSGMHNTLARLAALKKDTEMAQIHFRASLEGLISPASANYQLAVQARAARELTNLGLLDDAASLIEQDIAEFDDRSQRPSLQNARYAVLASELELINHQLMLAHKKSVLLQRTDSEYDIFNSDGGINVEALKKLSTSQLGQDLWVLEKTNYKENGYFVEFGATDGVLLSNSYLLEKVFNWDGICAEPNPDYFKRLVKNRDCKVSDACISASSGEIVEFVLANEYGGIAEMAKKGRHAEKVIAYQQEGNSVFLETLSLHDFLKAQNAPKVIDYLSIDTEGSEFEILKAFPFHEWEIRLISVEHNFELQREHIFHLLNELGYEREENQWDDYYVLRRHVSDA